MSYRGRKISISLTLAVFVFVSIFGSFGLMSSANAQLGASPAGPIFSFDVGMNAKALEGAWYEKLEMGAAMGIMSALQYFVQKIAYDMAVYAASGGKGQKPLLFSNKVGTYFTNVALDAAGEAVVELGAPFGLNLCSPPDISIDLALRLGLAPKFPQQPRCPWSALKKNYLDAGHTWASRYRTATGAVSSPKAFATAVQKGVKYDSTDTYVAMEAKAKVADMSIGAAWAATEDYKVGEGFKPVSDLISGKVKTPAGVVRKEATEQTGVAGQEKIATDQITSAMGKGALELGPYALSAFLNTFLTQMATNFFQKGMLFGFCVTETCEDQDTESVAENLATQFEAITSVGRKEAEQVFRDILTAKVEQVEDYNLLAEMTTCGDNPGKYNCVVDASLAQAIRQADLGEPITIREALDKGWLHGDWYILPPGRAAENQNRDCYKGAYCYGNIKVLRQARIFPLGFEIAAVLSGNDTPYRLKDVVAGFNDCSKGADGKIVYDPAKPFCHLIDPNWVIKLPRTKCDIMGYGAVPLAPGMPERQKECTGISSCVGYNKDGTCYAYGYCTREKNVWRFAADTCDPQYRTCIAFKNSKGQPVSYLRRTLDTTACTADDSGCLAYSLSKTSATAWTDIVLGDHAPQNAAAMTDYPRNNHIFFNSKVSVCAAGSAGCSAFKVSKAQDTLLYLRKAPAYAGCYDKDPSVLGVQWPTTKADLVNISLNTSQKGFAEECKQYAGVCIASEEGCNFFEPVFGLAERIPGKFTPASVSAEGTVTWNDQCDARCVGYAAYQELGGNYSTGNPLAYIIPSTGSTCAAEDAGCSSFTNLSTVAGGVENTEHYSYLRPCILPDVAKEKKFFTYEGSAAEGYQLKSYVLQADLTGADDQDNRAGGPKYWYRVPADAAVYDRVCNATVYAAGPASANWDPDLSPDCRQFNDEAGSIFYRLLAKTVAVDAKCTPYRLNSNELEPIDNGTIGSEAACTAAKGLWAGERCNVCYQGGEYRDGFCFYMGLPDGVANTAGVSHACAAAADTCRAYKGNAGNNIRLIFDDTFESGDTAGWVGANLNLSMESTRTGEHSLAFSGSNNSAASKPVALTRGKSYMLTFWAKGNGKLVEPSIQGMGGEEKSFGRRVSVGDTWQYYRFGPVEYSDTATSGVVKIVLRENGAVLFVDNVRFVEIVDHIYLVKKSLSIPAICDSAPDDNLPGEALGCAEYKDPNNTSFYLTNFSYLCREEAVGCTAVLDTQNNTEERAMAYNLWLQVSSDNLTDGGGKVELELNGERASCQAVNGEKGCYVNITLPITNWTDGAFSGAIAGAALTYKAVEIPHSRWSSNGIGARAIQSTIIVPPDTASSTPIYLVANRDATCNAVDLGCVKAGKQRLTAGGAKYDDVVIKNDPAVYEDALCATEAIGCETFSSGQSQYYFKDPQVVGQKVCEYKTDVMVNDTRSNGWFWKGTGKCECAGVSSVVGSGFCQSDEDCRCSTTLIGPGGFGTTSYTTGTCTAIGSTPCYPDFLRSGNYYGLWSFGVAGQYDDFVGECPSEQSGCTKYLDNNDKDQSTNIPKAYYLINNEKMTYRQSLCNGEVSERLGCILLDKTDDPNKPWNTAATYEVSRAKQDRAVAPVTAGENQTGDANTIVKVVRDRECGEWLYCDATINVRDSETGDVRSVCYSLGVCDRAKPGFAANQCASDKSGSRSDEDEGKILKTDIYLNRDVKWRGRDYSGFSLFNTYQIADLGEFIADGRPSIGRIEDRHSDCQESNGLPKNQRGNCGADNNQDGIKDGFCLDGSCIYSINGIDRTGQNSGVFDSDSFNYFTDITCRVYPESNSPYPPTVLSNYATTQTFESADKTGIYNYKSAFSGVNTCARYISSDDTSFDKDCDCSYYKLTYGNGADIRTAYTNTPPQSSVGAMCVGMGDPKYENGLLGNTAWCSATSTDDRGGKGIKLSQQALMYGTESYCVEPDVRKTINGDADQFRCLTWWPVEAVRNAKDTWLFNPDAGFVPPVDWTMAGAKEYICLHNEGVMKEPPKSEYHLWGVQRTKIGGGGNFDFYKTLFGQNSYAGYKFFPMDASNSSPLYPTAGDIYRPRIWDEEGEYNGRFNVYGVPRNGIVVAPRGGLGQEETGCISTSDDALGDLFLLENGKYYLDKPKKVDAGEEVEDIFGDNFGEGLNPVFIDHDTIPFGITTRGEYKDGAWHHGDDRAHAIKVIPFTLDTIAKNDIERIEIYLSKERENDSTDYVNQIFPDILPAVVTFTNGTSHVINSGQGEGERRWQSNFDYDTNVWKWVGAESFFGSGCESGCFGQYTDIFKYSLEYIEGIECKDSGASYCQCPNGDFDALNSTYLSQGIYSPAMRANIVDAGSNEVNGIRIGVAVKWEENILKGFVVSLYTYSEPADGARNEAGAWVNFFIVVYTNSGGRCVRTAQVVKDGEFYPVASELKKESVNFDGNGSEVLYKSDTVSPPPSMSPASDVGNPLLRLNRSNVMNAAGASGQYSFGMFPSLGATSEKWTARQVMSIGSAWRTSMSSYSDYINADWVARFSGGFPVRNYFSKFSNPPSYLSSSSAYYNVGGAEDFQKFYNISGNQILPVARLTYPNDKSGLSDIVNYMFRKTFGIWYWDGSRWQSDTAAQNLVNAVWDNPSSSGGLIRRPVIQAVDFDSCDSDAYGRLSNCDHINGSEGQFNIKYIYNSNVILESPGDVFIRFFAWAYGPQMPLSIIQIDPDKGADKVIGATQKSSYSNYIGRSCDSGREDCVNGFLDVNVNYGCEVREYVDASGYFHPERVPADQWFSNTSYLVNSSRGNIAKVEKGAGGAKIVDRSGNEIVELMAGEHQNFDNGELVCVYLPRVKVCDNYGMCVNGALLDDCLNNPAKCWTNFSDGTVARYVIIKGSYNLEEEEGIYATDEGIMGGEFPYE